MRRDLPDNAHYSIKNIDRFKLTNSVAYDSYSDTVMKFAHYRTGNSQLPNVSMIQNSYGVQLHDIVADRSNVSIINATWDYKFNTAQYRQIDADYVIYVLPEWEFDRITNN